jgi:hypothetical protein
MRTLRYVAILLAAWGVCASTSPQQNLERPPVLSVQTDLVTLPVIVVDRHGAIVTGLREDDFTVYDNGERRAIRFFTSEDVPATIGLVLDSSGSMRSRRELLTAAVTAFAAISHPLDELLPSTSTTRSGWVFRLLRLSRQIGSCCARRYSLLRPRA